MRGVMSEMSMSEMKKPSFGNKYLDISDMSEMSNFFGHFRHVRNVRNFFGHFGHVRNVREFMSVWQFFSISDQIFRTCPKCRKCQKNSDISDMSEISKMSDFFKHFETPSRSPYISKVNFGRENIPPFQGNFSTVFKQCTYCHEWWEIFGRDKFRITT